MTDDLTKRLAETETDSERLYAGKILDLYRLTVRLPSGKSALREVVRHKGACAVIPVNGRREAAMVWQYRAATGALSLEVPAGKLDCAGEDPLDCARRELLEETGLTAAHMAHLSSFYTSPGFSDEMIHLYMATGLAQGRPQPDEDENLQVEWIALDKLRDMAVKGRIRDGKSLIAILMAGALV